MNFSKSVPIFSLNLCNNCYNFTKIIKSVATTSKPLNHTATGPSRIQLLFTGSGSTTLQGTRGAKNAIGGLPASVFFYYEILVENQKDKSCIWIRIK